MYVCILSFRLSTIYTKRWFKCEIYMYSYIFWWESCVRRTIWCIHNLEEGTQVNNRTHNLIAKYYIHRMIAFFVGCCCCCFSFIFISFVHVHASYNCITCYMLYREKRSECTQSHWDRSKIQWIDKFCLKLFRIKFNVEAKQTHKYACTLTSQLSVCVAISFPHADNFLGWIWWCWRSEEFSFYIIVY